MQGENKAFGKKKTLQTTSINGCETIRDYVIGFATYVVHIL